MAFLTSQPIAAAPPKTMSPPIYQQMATPLAPQSNASLFNMLAPTTTASPPPMAANRQPSYMAPTATSMFSSPVMAPMSSNIPRTGSVGPAATTPVAKPASSGSFDDLWSMSLGTSASKPQAAASGPAKSIQDLQKEKAQAAIWGSNQTAKPPMGAGFGSFGGAAGSTSTAAPPSSSNNGIDDLLF